ncbi:endonuclease [Neobacillus notoginsengisoli]|uniref:Endonuclease n=1 Tax=Neobacillus notoginsengisoli TaxID=1578198 RepID=A0A417YTZ4_9BACI|nr:endonuclease [Neobacillus notoginsengisoli]RHW40618.1 endonuclease [Neobacillus notoginsengisoli]
MRKLFALLAVFTLAFAVIGCSNKEEPKGSEDTKKEENKAELTDQVKSKMYNAIRLAENKVDTVYANDTDEDTEKPVLNATFADEAAAEAFLTKYYSEDVAKQISSHYSTGEKNKDGRPFVKEDPFFAKPISGTTQDDVTIEGDANKGTVKTKDGVTYTVELKDGQYVITGVES